MAEQGAQVNAANAAPEAPAVPEIDPNIQAIINAIVGTTDARNEAMLNAIQAATQQLQAALNALPAAAAANPQPQVAAVNQAGATFLRTPLRSGITDVMDFSSKDGRKYYEQATKSLFDSGNKFDVEPSSFQTFINLLHVRCRDLGMLEPGMNMMMPLGGTMINTITDYGRTTLEQVTAWESSFISLPNRQSQNSKMLYDMLMNSLSTQGIQRIQVWQHQYHLANEDSGGCLLKIIVRESYLDSNATVSTLRLNLSNLDTYVRDNGSDIVALNAYVQSQVNGLAARG